MGARFAEELSAMATDSEGSGIHHCLDVLKKECRKRAGKGFTGGKICMLDFIGDVSEIVQEANMLGLVVVFARKNEDALHMKVQWPQEQKRTREYSRSVTPQRSKKKRRLQDGAQLSEFVVGLSSASAASSLRREELMDKHIGQVKKECHKRAQKGFDGAKICLLEFPYAASEMAEEAEMLGLEVVSANKREDTLHMQVRWPREPGAEGAWPPSGLEAGNLTGLCKLCLTEETMCRTHAVT
jgi:hypothetical protein